MNNFLAKFKRSFKEQIKMAIMEEPLLEVKNLKAYYYAGNTAIRAVDDVTFSVGKSEILGIAGESGCGKSTLALAITRLLRPPGYIKEGKIIFNGEDLLKLDDEELREIRWKHISYIPQSSMNALNPVLRVKDQFIDAMKEHGVQMDKNEIDAFIKDLLLSVGLTPEVSKMYPHELSGGMRQRVIIAMATALRPELVIADEPTTALDVVVQRGIVQLLSNIRRKYKSSVILITHDMAVQAEIVDRLAMMYAGKIVEIGDVRSVFKMPLHPYTQTLINSIPSIGQRKRLLGIKGLPPDLKSPPPGCRFHPRCPYKFKPCNEKEPPLVNVDHDRFVACFLYGGLDERIT